MSILTSKDGTAIAFDKQGQGPAVILVDGAMCYRNAGPMTPLAALLETDFTVFTYDRRGRGESSDTLPFAVEREIEDIEALIKEAGGSAFVYGISSGGALSIAAATRLPSIKKLALYEVPYVALDESGRQAAAEYTKRLTEILSTGQRGDAIALFMTRVGMPAEAMAGMRHSPMWAGLEAIAPTLGYDNAVMGDSTVPPQAASISVPTLVMDGGASPAFLRDAAKTLANAIPGAQYRTLEGQTHDVAATATAPVLKEFFLNHSTSN
jgi:pimeloyl-ACP methyl ester carboxylesterase